MVQQDDNLAADGKNVVKSLIKGLRVLEAFSAGEPELTMAEIARRSGVDNATAFRFLGTLVSAGYVCRVPDTRLFRLTTKVLDLGFSAIAHADLRTCARPILRGLVGEINEAASVGVLEGWEVMYAERMQAGLTRLGVDIRIGSRVPAYSTAIGHAILAWLPKSDQKKILGSHPRPALTPTTLTDIDEILRRLQTVRERGYAVSDQENVSGLFIVAAPVLDADGVPVAGLSVAAPALRMRLPEFEALAADPVRTAAAELSKSLQASGCFATSVNSRTA
ncbi:MAG: IclR family transcriptional regulator [Castellaniella sp.]|uniref:IclR family transcriptional regulator n=1 Tax=Castellaniella sp. TaxID=1955812 RepID=UPI0012040F81|nr:IclR family transcriptional regulator [Castellaniella sp.]TAN27373.1 MAG: IclR family transcriptional regulator [Castellaniella sp.]